MRTAYLGTSDFAAAVLRALAASPHRPALVVTRPDRPRGRGRALAAPPAATVARELGIDVFQPERVNDDDAVARIAAVEPELLLVCAYGALLRAPLLERFELLNVHPSLLPRWRGAAPIERAIMAGDARTGVSIMRVTAGLDSGPVCLRAEEPISDDDTYGTLAPRLERLGAELLLRALDERPAFEEQDEAHVTYAEKIERADRRLDPSARTAVELDRVVRALTPHVGAQLTLAGGEPLGVRAVRVVAGEASLPPSTLTPTTTGDGLLLGCAQGVLELLEVQPAGGRAMPAADYLRGRGVPALATSANAG